MQLYRFRIILVQEKTHDKGVIVSRLTLEKTMQTSFVAIGDRSSDKAFHDFNRRIGLLAESGKLRQEDVRELISTDRDVSTVIEGVAKAALSEGLHDESEGFYLPGYTAVVADESGELLGAQEKPNDIEKLKSYGPSLMWAMRKIGHERYAASRTSDTGSERRGYVVVSTALTGKPLEAVPYGDRHHVGGASVRIENGDIRSSSRYMLVLAVL